MNRINRDWIVASLATLMACGLIGLGCGDDDSSSTTSTTSGGSAEETIDSAVATCESEASKLGGAAGTALKSACGSVGNAAKQAASSGGEAATQALAQAESTCRSAVSSFPDGEAQTALSSLCDSISSAE